MTMHNITGSFGVTQDAFNSFSLSIFMVRLKSSRLIVCCNSLLLATATTISVFRLLTLVQHRKYTPLWVIIDNETFKIRSSKIGYVNNIILVRTHVIKRSVLLVKCFCSNLRMVNHPPESSLEEEIWPLLNYSERDSLEMGKKQIWHTSRETCSRQQDTQTSLVLSLKRLLKNIATVTNVYDALGTF